MSEEERVRALKAQHWADVQHLRESLEAEKRKSHPGQEHQHQRNDHLRIDVYHHFPRDAEREGFEQKILGILTRQEHHMAALDDQLDAAVAAAEAEDTKIDSMIALFKQMTQPLGLSADQQAKLDRITAAISDNPDRIQAAIDANTSPAPPADATA